MAIAPTSSLRSLRREWNGSTSSINSSLLDNTEELVEVLDLFANSPILNPTDSSKNVTNTNFYAVLNMAF
jgi:hypothetical protein